MERTELSGLNEYIQKNYVYTGDLLREALVIGHQQNRVPELMGSYIDMYRNYMYAYPIEVVTTRNGKVIDSDVFSYSANTYGVYHLSDHYKLCVDSPIDSYQSAKLFSRDSRCEKYQTIESCDPFGKPNYVDTQGSKCAYFWSYGGKYPVMVVEGLSMKEILDDRLTSESFIYNLSKNGSYINDIDEIRNKIYGTFPNCLISTYTYLPQVGMTSETAPDGTTTFYEYDAFGRLQRVKDHLGNILQQYEYQYGNP